MMDMELDVSGLDADWWINFGPPMGPFATKAEAVQAATIRAEQLVLCGFEAIVTVNGEQEVWPFGVPRQSDKR